MVTINNAINNTVGASNSGATNTLTVTNSSNTASSASNVGINVGGSSAGDPQVTFTVTGATDWSLGIDNSASDAYVIAASTALGTTNVISMATAGGVSCVLGNFDTTRSASGADVSVTASNTSNTASSSATHYATVAGTSAGDAQTQYAVSGTTTWTQGIDNSVSGDPFVLAASSALGTTNVMSATTGGAVSFVLGNVDVTKSASGADVSVTASNTSNTASSSATLYVTVAGTSAGDARTQYAVSGTTTWTHGIDNSDSDNWILAQGTTLGTNNTIVATTAGEVTKPLQPAFLAYNSTTRTNVTGNGAVATVTFDTEVFDVNSDFASNTFTAPVTGKYLLCTSVVVGGFSAASLIYCTITTSNRNYSSGFLNPVNIRGSSGFVTIYQSSIVDMDAADTATVTVTATGEAGDTDDIFGQGNPTTYFSGALIC